MTIIVTGGAGFIEATLFSICWTSIRITGSSVWTV